MSAARIPETFGAWVRTRRKMLDLTQAELGQRAGCSAAAIRKIEANERNPSRQLAELLARALDIPTGEKEIFLQFARGAIPQDFGPQPARASPNNLPVLLTATIDRQHDLSVVTAFIRDPGVHLITLVGPPGIGKTRLSIQCGKDVLDSFPDGVWFIDLAEIDAPDFFTSAIARSLATFDFPPSPSLSHLLSRFKDKNLLLILDNLEHIVEKAALDVAQLLKGCPRLKILATSRVPLHIYGEQEYPLPPLSIPPRGAEFSLASVMQFEAVQLFVARVKGHQPQFTITPEVTASIVEICNILEGIPLALELAAATLRQMTLDEMTLMLCCMGGTNWVSQLGASARDLPPRQRTLENVIDWSFALLSEEQRAFFCKLGIFSGWFDADAATAISENNAKDALAFLNALTDHSLLMRQVLKDGKTHWRMLEIIHEYAASRLDGGQIAHLQRLRADHFMGQLKELRHVSREHQEACFQANVDNIHGALHWLISEGQAESGFQMAFWLEGLWSSLGYFREGLHFIKQLLVLPAAADPLTRASRFEMAADLAWQQHDFEASLAYANEAAELGRVHGLREQYPWYLNRLGRIYIEQENYVEARAALTECLSLAYEDPTRLNPGSPLAQLGEIALFEGRPGEAKSLFEGALTHLSTDDSIFLAIAQTDLAEVALAQGDYEGAHSWLKRTYAPARSQFRRAMAFLSALAGWLVLSTDQKDAAQKAAQFYGAMDQLCASSGLSLNSFYQNLNQSRAGLLRQRISEGEWQRAVDSGRSWGKDEAMDQAQAALGL